MSALEIILPKRKNSNHTAKPFLLKNYLPEIPIIPFPIISNVIGCSPAISHLTTPKSRMQVSPKKEKYVKMTIKITSYMKDDYRAPEPLVIEIAIPFTK